MSSTTRARPLALAMALLLFAACSPAEQPEPSTPSLAAAPTTSPPSPTPTPDPAKWIERENSLPGDASWRIASPASATDLAGFVDHTGGPPGTKLVLKVTTTAPTFTVTAFRLGDYAGLGARKVWSSSDLNGIVQPAVKVLDGNMVSAAHWTPAATIDTLDWPEGHYFLRLVDSLKRAKWIPYTVSSTAFEGRVAIMAATTTYQAYNEYGGYSLYRGRQGFADRARRVSFDRPYDGYGARHLWGYESSVIADAERTGINLAYITNEDLEKGPAAFHGVRGIISPGHDEYWSVAMRNTVEALRDGGTNLAFLGANAVYWRVRLADDGRVVVGYKSAAEDPVKGETSTALWRHRPSSRPESTLVGMLYECYPAEGDLVVSDPSFFLFDGTGVSQGTRIKNLNGPEIDRAYPGGLAPDNLQVVAHSPIACGKATTHADASYYTVASGAGVFSTGTMNWGPRWNLDGAGRSFVARVNENLVRAMAAGPMGITHPAVGNLADIKPNPSTATGTGGSVADR